MSVCEGFFQKCRHDQLRDENEGLAGELKASQTIVAKLQYRVVNAKRNLLEKENVGALLKEKEKAWEEERAGWMVERERLVGDVKHYKVAGSVSGSNVDILFAELGIIQEDNQKLAAEHH
ncbi:hypothetical protein Hdeb2414_s0001g00017241 [Helianthus debilis subsp. tardiflorus]